MEWFIMFSSRCSVFVGMLFALVLLFESPGYAAAPYPCETQATIERLKELGSIRFDRKTGHVIRIAWRGNKVADKDFELLQDCPHVTSLVFQWPRAAVRGE